MWFPDLNTAGIDETTKFFLLAWEELFGKTTSTTYTPRQNDTLSLINELGILAEQGEKDERLAYHLVYVIDELQEFIKNDPVLGIKYPHFKYALQNLDRKEKPTVIRRLSAAIGAGLKDYENSVFEHFLETISTVKSNEKDKILTATRLVATRAVQRGLISEECRLTDAQSMLLLSPQDAGEKLLEQIRQEDADWDCILCIEGGSYSEIESLIYGTGFEKLPASLKPFGKDGTNFLENYKDFFKANSTVKAKNYIEAFQKAFSPLKRVLDVANFKHRSAPFKVLPSICLRSGRDQRFFDLDVGAYSGIEAQNHATQSAVKMQRAGVLERLPDRIITTLEQHSVAHATTDPKVRFVNLWFALETLVRYNRHHAIIEEVVNNITPLIAHRRINKVIKYLAICLHNYGFCDSIPNSTGWFDKSDSKDIHRNELLLALTGKAGRPVLAELLKITASHSLLCNRLFTVYCFLNDSNKLIKELEKSYERTLWQIQRIYRARNVLVHTGGKVNLLSKLTMDLEHYYSVTMARILYDFEQNDNNWSIEKSFDSHKLMYEYFIDTLKDFPDKITVANALNRAANALDDQPLW